MTLAPLLNAPLVIQIHAASALSAFVLGTVQLAAPKGTLPHRTCGWIWVVLMLTVAGTSFWINDFNQFLGFSVIHLLSIWTLIAVPLALLAVRRGNVRTHRTAMISLFVGALVIAGIFTLLPGRIMNAVVFGG